MTYSRKTVLPLDVVIGDTLRLMRYFAESDENRLWQSASLGAGYQRGAGGIEGGNELALMRARLTHRQFHAPRSSRAEAPSTPAAVRSILGAS
jgi:hypothetical protein